jgi:hypothetical protein
MTEPTEEQLNRRAILYSSVLQGLLASGKYFASPLEPSFAEEQIKRLRKDAQEVYDGLTGDKPKWFGLP